MSAEERIGVGDGMDWNCREVMVCCLRLGMMEKHGKDVMISIAELLLK